MCVIVLKDKILPRTSVSSGIKLGKVIIDTDAGADDAVAIILTLLAESRMSEEDLKVLAITCTYGNTYLKNVEQNVLKILTMLNQTNIPVYGGASKPLLKHYVPTDYFGSDGLGDFQFDKPLTTQIDRSKHASLALIDLVKQHPGEITLLCLGPLTNVATAIAIEPSFLQYLKGCVIMGSSVRGIGNVGPNIEFNFDLDPESNYIVLNSIRKNPCLLFPWETALTGAISKEWRVNTLGALNNSVVEFLNKAEEIVLKDSANWTPVDGMAAASMIWGSLIKQSVVTNVNAVICGEACGSVQVDYTNATGRFQNAEIVESFDSAAFQDILLEYLS